MMTLLFILYFTKYKNLNMKHLYDKKRLIYH